MENKLEKLLGKKKKGKEMSDNEKDAKMSVVEALRNFAQGEMGKKVSGLKKTNIMGDMGVASSEVSEGEESEGPDLGMDLDEELEDDSSDEMSEEEIDAKLEELMTLKAKIKG